MVKQHIGLGMYQGVDSGVMNLKQGVGSRILSKICGFDRALVWYACQGQKGIVHTLFTTE